MRRIHLRTLGYHRFSISGSKFFTLHFSLFTLHLNDSSLKIFLLLSALNEVCYKESYAAKETYARAIEDFCHVPVTSWVLASPVVAVCDHSVQEECDEQAQPHTNHQSTQAQSPVGCAAHADVDVVQVNFRDFRNLVNHHLSLFLANEQFKQFVDCAENDQHVQRNDYKIHSQNLFKLLLLFLFSFLLIRRKKTKILHFFGEK